MHQPQGLREETKQQHPREKLWTSEAFTREIWLHKVEPSVLPWRRQFAATFCNEETRNQYGRHFAAESSLHAARSRVPRRNSAILRQHPVSGAGRPAPRLGIRLLCGDFLCSSEVRCSTGLGAESWLQRPLVHDAGRTWDSGRRTRSVGDALARRGSSVESLWLTRQASLRKIVLDRCAVGLHRNQPADVRTLRTACFCLRSNPAAWTAPITVRFVLGRHVSAGGAVRGVPSARLHAVHSGARHRFLARSRGHVVSVWTHSSGE